MVSNVFLCSSPNIFQLGWNHQLAPWISLVSHRFFFGRIPRGHCCVAVEHLLKPPAMQKSPWASHRSAGAVVPVCLRAHFWEIDLQVARERKWLIIFPWPFWRQEREQRIPRNKHNMVLKWLISEYWGWNNPTKTKRGGRVQHVFQGIIVHLLE